MPIKIDNDLPAKSILEQENIFVMDENCAIHQDIRPLEIIVLNLMPIKQDTELQLLRSLSNTPLQVNHYLSLLAFKPLLPIILALPLPSKLEFLILSLFYSLNCLT